MNHLFRHGLLGAVVVAVAACGGGADDPGTAQTREAASARSARIADARLQSLALPRGAASKVLDPRLARARGHVEVWVSLAEPSVASYKASQLELQGIDMQSRSLGPVSKARATSADDQSMRGKLRSHRDALRGTQDDLMGQLRGAGALELGRVQVAHNAVAIRVNAASLQAIAQMPGVVKVRPVINYKLDLSETVPYVGGSLVQASGVTGAGVKVAVLDSGIDYTHKNLGGAGTLGAYEAAYGSGAGDARNTTRDGLFPTAKVVDGYDFVGESWPEGDLAPDEDPIDLEGHGTHVADIIAGRSIDGTHKGMAPGALLYAVKVCSAVASSCSGVALLQGMDFALDPNGDGDTSDAVDVVNMSLGSDYGQIEDDLSLAAANAVKLGVVVVASAGNGGNKPYVAGSPATAVGVISVAQTQVPSAVAIPLVINAPAAIAGVYPNTETLSYAPVGAGAGGDVVYYGRGCPDDPELGNPAGKIALIDRGACSVSLKVDRAAKAGAKGVIIGLVAPGDPISFSFGGGDTFVPSLVVQQSVSNLIKAQLAAGVVNVSFSPASSIALIGSMAGSSSRGPATSTQHIKPEIGAPGASVSAVAGSGAEQTAFGGTSGAAPMVAGAAALLIEAFPTRSPMKIKAMLMNSAETVVYTNPALAPGQLAPITRVGAGELRVARAIGLGAIAWNRETRSAALSFGAVEVAKKTRLERSLRIENFTDTDQTFSVTPSFRFADDAASGAVTVRAPSRVRVAARSREDIEVSLEIDPSRLPIWTLNGGAKGADGAALDGPEYDGYLTLSAGALKLSVPWHVLPRKAADNEARLEERRGQFAVRMANAGAESGDFDLFSLTGVSRKIPRSQLPRPGDNFAVTDLRAFGVRHLPAAVFGEDFLEFAISTQGRRAHPNVPAEFDVYIDVDGDGVDDYLVYNQDLGALDPVVGQNVVVVVSLAAGTGTIVAFADADLNSGNMIFSILLSDIGATPGTTLGLSVLALDNYFTGEVTDAIEGMRFTPGNERYRSADPVPFGSVPPKTRASAGLSVTSVPNSRSSEIGMLVMHRRNAEREADILRIR